MISTKHIIVAGLLTVVGGALAGIVMVRHRTPKPAAPIVCPPERIPAPAPAPPAASAPLPGPPSDPIVQAPAPMQMQRPAAPRPVAGAQHSQQPPPAETMITEDDARAALALVGLDPMAEHAWCQAINDPSLSANARQNLIEDLNEDGFPDHRNITPDDLPLIVNRLALIEQLAPEAMDDVNAAAFEEAYKDLINMLLRVTQ